jgi:sulfate/thiosulfate transport system ATP-binding protein
MCVPCGPCATRNGWTNTPPRQVRKLKVNHASRVADLLQLVQLQGLGDRYPKQLSGGQRQRVALARALASNPQLLLLDEPFGALDAVVRKSLRQGLKEIVRSVGVTTIIVTHDQVGALLAVWCSGGWDTG